MKRYFFIFTVLFLCSPVYSEKGVAFVHGTGNPSDALNSYWTRAFVDSVRQGLPDSGNYLVVNCNFDAYMWEDAAAGCLAAQLVSFINRSNISDLTIIAHSNGANVVRWILSNPTWDSRYPGIIDRVTRVSAMAPSSAGTPLAEAVIEGNTFEKSLGWILGYATDAVRMQQPSWMAYYNSTWLFGTTGRPTLPSDFLTIIGTDVETAIWDSDSYCGGYATNLGLEITQAWLNRCSDGFIECSSQESAGTVWFRDKSRTNGREPLSHNQSRRKCFGLDIILRNSL